MKDKVTALTVNLVLILLVTSQVWADQADSTKEDDQEQYFIIETRHRLHPKFVQIDTVKMDGIFYIGEEEYKAEVIAFNPHLGITMEGEALQMSDTLYNPAVRIRVSLDDELEQESWGFSVISSPHFRREDLLAFRLVDFKVSEEYIKAPARK